MTSNQIREAFFEFFREKHHHVIPSAPMVIKNDPTLMFTNAGMNQFKDIFLGNKKPNNLRIANTQKCLRVSGKHNDLEEVGQDTYHHTMFEMLGNWSFGDYFKKEAITWSIEFLVDKLGIDKNRLYATVFEGNKEENLARDQEASKFWTQVIDKDRIIDGSKKDNFWEMGDTGPCGPCSEIHIDLRNDKEREKISGRSLINKNHPLVIELWNLVFIQYNRKADGNLEILPKKHVDTGLGFERLSMVIQKKQSNYDTDIFQPVIQELSRISGKKYGEKDEWDIALRVVADHLRAVSFSIADGQIPSNNKAGYVIRRILRRAIRYGYTFLGLENPFIYLLVPVLTENMGKSFPELRKQHDLIIKVIKEEETSFLKTLDSGISLLDIIMDTAKKDNKKEVSGKVAFKLYDTYGFPLDLTELILKEKKLSINHKEFENEMKAQKSRSKQASIITTEDWTQLKEDDTEEFIGYDKLESDIYITRYRKVITKGKEQYQLIFNFTPFYATAGGQIGDSGYIESEKEKIQIIDTISENELSIHLTKKFPDYPQEKFHAVVNKEKRLLTANNHSATHLLHYALRKILGNHVEQKGSLVTPDHLRFDFSHFQKVNDTELVEIETMVNSLIRENIEQKCYNIPMEEAQNKGAIALFGEKYSDIVRVIQFGESIELCGGTHVTATGQIGFFKITSENAIAAGIRRIEAITALKSEKYIRDQLEIINEIKNTFKSSRKIMDQIRDLVKENSKMSREIETMERNRLKIIRNNLLSKVLEINGINFIAEVIEISSAAAMRDLAFQMKNEMKNLFLLTGAEINGKANLALMISNNLVKDRGLHAENIIREIAKKINGGGGGQSFFATAGGKNPSGLNDAIIQAKEIVSEIS
ncbi:MAG: alanine--tRNA ligase [Bacteroidetes bacterium]|nr:alanine--tRNA ligase [Bacteroidota bacterium]